MSTPKSSARYVPKIKYRQDQNITYYAIIPAIEFLPEAALEICERIKEDTGESLSFVAQSGKYFLVGNEREIRIDLKPVNKRWHIKVIFKIEI